AEMHASEVLGVLEEGIAGAASEITLRPEDAGFAPFDMLLAQLVAHAERQRTPASLAVLRALAPLVNREFRQAVDDAATRVAASGVPDPAWAATIGHPTVERCWRFGDIFGSQTSYHVVFAYGRRRHLLAVLVDNVLGGGIKDSWVSDKPDRLWTEVRRESERQSDTFLEEIPWGVARAALLDASEREPCPVDPDQVEDVARYAPLLRARLSLPAGDDAATAGGATEPAVRRRRRPKEVLQLKVSLKGSKPPIWRRLEVPATITLDELHEVIQVAFEWTDSHLHAFETPQGEYGVPDPEWGLDLRSERGVRLTKVAEVGEKLTYVYDFGDDWQHVVLVEKVSPSQEGVAY
ncbi:MAG: plasmid pRiA4b ORF-3 family protein, partial [Actinomycetes bacterium]|nr:plasmid pRiA4b ORF-3 family protein [Actinomycetes bacterium]